MFVPLETPHTRLSSRRLGGPLPFRDLWPTLKEDLQEVCLGSDDPAELEVIHAATTQHAKGTSA